MRHLCELCVRPCVFITQIPTDEEKPANCPYGGTVADWKEQSLKPDTTCELCDQPVCFERSDPETQPPEYNICEICDRHVCPDCMIGDICKLCSKEA